MEHSGEIIKSKPHLVKQSPDGTTTAESLEIAAETISWLPLLKQLAQTKRQDLAPGAREFWKAKLKNYTEQEVCKALMLYSGEFFPDPDKIAEIIDHKRLRSAEMKSDLYWVEYERNNRDIERFMREHDGKTPQQVWCEENQKALQKLNQLTVGGIDAGRATVTKVSANRAVSSSDGAQGKSGHGANSDLPAKSTDEMAGVQGDVQPGGTGAKSL